jgi:hypothetical protein
LLIIFGMFLTLTSIKAQVASRAYLQEIKKDISLPQVADNNVIRLFQIQGNIIAVTENGIYRKTKVGWTGNPNGFSWKTACVDIKGKVWLATDDFIQNEDGTVKIDLPEYAGGDSILCLFWEDKTLYAGTSSGLLAWNGSWKSIEAAKGKRVNAIALENNGDLWVATNDGLLQRKAGEWVNLDDVLMANGTKRMYLSLYTPDNGNYVLFGGLFTVGCIAENGDNWMWTGSDGLPYGPVTTIWSNKNVLWLGTAKGAIKKDKTWHYYLGKRWLPDNKVNDILPIDEHTVWIATPQGISQIQEVEMTLPEKAAIYEDVIQKRHIRRGLVNVSHLSVHGDLSSSKTINEDNDGLWTSTYLAAECFRYAVTKDPEARENAIRTFEAMERLETVSGIPGLPARSFAMVTDSVVQSRSPHPKLWRPSPDGKWQWLDDTSSDEIVGHMFALPLFYDLVADNEMEQRIKVLVQRLMDHIIDNDFRLIDYDGKPTRWGIWTPDSLNNSTNWAYEKDLYSLEILSFLKAAVYITGSPKYEKTYRQLIEKYHYVENMLQAKKYGPFENSHSDDILTYFPYYSLSRYAAKDEYCFQYQKSLERTWAVSRPDKMPAWNIIASIVLQKDCGLQIALEQLQEYPVDLIDWSIQNSHRWDLQEDPMVGRGGDKQATRPIPIPESGISRWNTNPRKFDTGRKGTREETGTYFLLPYWMARYHGLFK